VQYMVQDLLGLERHQVGKLTKWCAPLSCPCKLVIQHCQLSWTTHRNHPQQHAASCHVNILNSNHKQTVCQRRCSTRCANPLPDHAMHCALASSLERSTCKSPCADLP
jgi:hypothetical protein